jgi:serine protease
MTSVGREVITLVDEVKPAGEYQVSFDGSGLPSGVYIYRIETGKYVQARKLILLR